MKTLYIDCSMGAAGDMLTAALLELLPNPEAFIEKLNHLGIPGVHFDKEPMTKCGILGTHMHVYVRGEEEQVHEADHELGACEHSCEHYHEHSHYHGHEDHVHEHMHLHEHDDHSHGHTHDDHVHLHEHNTHSHEHTHAADVHKHPHEHTGDNHAHSHHHTDLHEIEHIISHLPLSDKVRQDMISVYQLIAEAESHAHGVPVSQIHFHEVGNMDAIADVTAVCMLMDEIHPDEVVVSPIHVGSGYVKCAHGILPVPAPATAFILKDVPVYGGKIKSELCTPTGSALLKYFADRFGDMPVMKTQAIGYGMGKKNFEIANCVRAMLGETEDNTDKISELSCNVDDMTAEAIGFASEQLMEAGALDVYTIPIGMKKSRPGTLIRVMCTEQQKELLIHLLFKYTTTIGIRETLTQRYILQRSITTLDTPYGTIHRKDVSGYGVHRSKFEYEDLAQAARKHDISLQEITDFLNKNW